MFTNGPAFVSVGDKIDGELSADRKGRFVVVEVRATAEPPAVLLVGAAGGQPFSKELAELERLYRTRKVTRRRAEVVSYAPKRGKPKTSRVPRPKPRSP